MFQLAQASKQYKLSLLAASVAAAMTATSAFAEESQENVQETNMIEIKGQATAGLDSLVTQEDLEKTTASDLGEIFRLDPQVNAGGGVSLGQKLYLRNIGEDALNISVDGAEQANAIFHHAGRVSVEPELLKQVEVEAGPGSATAGFGALGGAVRFVTKDPSDLLEPGEQAGALIKGTYYSNSEGYKASSSVYGRDSSDSLSVLATFVRSEHDVSEDGNGDDINGSDADQKMSYAKLVANMSDEQKLSISIENMDDKGDMPYRSEWIAPTAKNTISPTEANRRTAILNYEYDSINNDLLDLMVNVYQTKNEQNRFAEVDATALGIGVIPTDNLGEVETFGFTVQNTSLIANHKLIYGVNYRDDESSLTTTRTASLGVPAVDGMLDAAFEMQSSEEEGKAKALYLQDVIDVTNDLVVSLGVRYDDYEVDQVSGEVSDDAISPNLSANFTVNSNLSVSAGYSQAFRGPEVVDAYRAYAAVPAFFEDAAPARDENIEGEKSNNFEIGFDFNYENFGLSAGAYVLTIENAVYLEYDAGPIGFRGRPVGEYQNMDDDIETTGFYVKADYHWEGLMAALSFHSAKTEIDDQEAYRNITGSTATSIGDKVIADVSYEFNNDLLIGWTGEFVKGFNISVDDEWSEGAYDEVNKPGYGVHDVYARWLPTSDEDLSLTLTVKNIFDKQYLDHASSEDLTSTYPWIVGQNEPGRDVRLTAALRI
ncbi:TonB-dependent receptor domain-containing protein [Litoribrevibacter euphylliae]|uniref:TonB-dependent receptor domain-containing protein n=1 Tax=Litoribrevibacter euphylliae TaxID=1834034 RepID=A0ABV7HFV8_9GAMM